jgi:hypothetical protein
MKELSIEMKKEIEDIIIKFDFDKIIAYIKISNMNYISKNLFKEMSFSILSDCVLNKSGFIYYEWEGLMAKKNIIKGKTQLTLRYYIEESKNY